MKICFKVIFAIIFLSISISTNAQVNKDRADSSQINRFNHSVELDLRDAISISYRNYLTSNWDAALNIYYKGKFTHAHGDALNTSNKIDRRSEITISICPSINYKIFNSTIVNLFLGSGLKFTYKNYFRQYLTEEYNSNIYRSDQRIFSVIMITKLDVDITKNIKLYSYYNLKAGFSNGSINDFSTITGKRTFIELDNLTLGVGIYF